MDKKVFYLLHLANKAGKLRFGMGEVERSCSFNKAKLVLFAEDFSQNSRKKIEKLKIVKKVSFIEFSNKKKYGFEFHKRDLGILSIEDINFAKGISDLFKSGTED
ncbi:MAG: ribosomal L7Ae/L30e/S12e/Gadd45 family protein [Candidatus Cloacimonetes bacterium]|nr:ribosomal L7Ae/L30e/S12e/Gadd45 family protein [Candidatus Cloacimonadota bacterium]